MQTDAAGVSSGSGDPAPLPVGRSLLTRLLATPAHRVATAVAVLSLGVAPVALFPTESPIYAGIATAAPTFYSYTGALILAAGLLAAQTPRRFLGGLLPWTPFLGWLITLTATAWDASARTGSGLLHLCLGIAAFAVGATAGRLDGAGALLSWTFAAAAWAQLTAIATAAIGFPLREVTGAQALDVLGRATGLTAHPGELAKLLFFCALCALTLPHRTAQQRWAAWLTLGAAFVGVSLAQSRTVLAAIMSMVVIFVLLDRVGGRWQRRHFVIIGGTFLLGVTSLPWLIERFLADPTGGARQHVARVAQAVVQDHPFTGVGPNGYVAVVGADDPLTATGVPVHNIFLLSAAELGIVGAVLLWLPFAMVAARAAARVWRTRGIDPAARIVISALPGIVLIGMTGWGLLQGPYLLIFSLVIGHFGARIGAAPVGAAPDTGRGTAADTGTGHGPDPRVEHR